MEYEFAPLEGITDAVYRTAHHRFYPGIDRYYTPFISPTQNHVFTPRDRRELDPANNAGFVLVPQLLGKNTDDMIWAAGELRRMGYREIDINLGCPSGTVLAKGKGAGMLADPGVLDRFLDRLFSGTDMDISVKTRLGVKRAEEFMPLLEVFGRYPLKRLIIHARTAAEMYSGDVHREYFAYAAEHTSIPLSYNGDLFSKDDITRFLSAYPKTEAVMIGRGLIADPGLVCGGDADTLRAFHAELCERYPVVFGNKNSAMHRMKAIWAYMVLPYPNSEKWKKRIIKAKHWNELLSLADRILSLEKEERSSRPAGPSGAR